MHKHIKLFETCWTSFITTGWLWLLSCVRKSDLLRYCSYGTTMCTPVYSKDWLLGPFRGICPWIMWFWNQILNYRSQICDWTYQLSIRAFLEFFIFSKNFRLHLTPDSAQKCIWERTFFIFFLGEQTTWTVCLRQNFSNWCYMVPAPGFICS